jgi:hypothetical protein
MLSVAPARVGREPRAVATLAAPRAISSAGRAPPRQGGGHWFEPSIAHNRRVPRKPRSGGAFAFPRRNHAVFARAGHKPGTGVAVSDPRAPPWRCVHARAHAREAVFFTYASSWHASPGHGRDGLDRREGARRARAWLSRGAAPSIESRALAENFACVSPGGCFLAGLASHPPFRARSRSDPWGSEPGSGRSSPAPKSRRHRARRDGDVRFRYPLADERGAPRHRGRGSEQPDESRWRAEAWRRLVASLTVASHAGGGFG